MALTDDEKATLKALQEKEAAKDDGGPSVSFNVDLSDDRAVARAKKLGYLPADFEADDDSDDDDEDEDDAAGKKKARPAKKDDAPKRRLSGADRWAGGKDE